MVVVKIIIKKFSYIKVSTTFVQLVIISITSLVHIILITTLIVNLW